MFKLSFFFFVLNLFSEGRLLRAAQRIQGGARRLLWRRRMVDNVKEFLAEIDEMDLLLDAKEPSKVQKEKRFIKKNFKKKKEKKDLNLKCHLKEMISKRMK